MKKQIVKTGLIILYSILSISGYTQELYWDYTEDELLTTLRTKNDIVLCDTVNHREYFSDSLAYVQSYGIVKVYGEDTFALVYGFNVKTRRVTFQMIPVRKGKIREDVKYFNDRYGHYFTPISEYKEKGVMYIWIDSVPVVRDGILYYLVVQIAKRYIDNGYNIYFYYCSGNNINNIVTDFNRR